MNTLKWLLISGFVATALPASAVSMLKTAEAKDHIGEHASVCGQIASIRTDTSNSAMPTVIDLDSAYPKQVFSIRLTDEARTDMANMARVGAKICATGEIKDDHGVPEIEAQTRSQISP